MHIVYLVQHFFTPDQAGSSRPYELTRRFAKAGHRVSVVASDWNRDDRSVIHEVVEGVDIYRIGVPYSQDMGKDQRVRSFLQFAASSARQARRLDPDIIYATSAPLTIALPGAYASKRCKAKMVFEVRDLWPKVPIAIGAIGGPVLPRVAALLEKFAYSRSSHIVALSPDMKRGITETGYPEENVTVVPNSCDFDIFGRELVSGDEFRARNDWLGKRPLVVYTGTLGKINGVDFMAEVAAKAQLLEPNLRFLSLGSGSEWGKVESRARELGVLGRNFFMMPNRPKSEVAQVLAAADVATSFVVDIPELEANSANKVFDAMAAGKPFAINHDGWQAELIREHDCGLVLSRNPEIAASELASAVTDREWLSRAGSNSERLGRERFHRDVLAAEVLDILERSSR